MQLKTILLNIERIFWEIATKDRCNALKNGESFLPVLRGIFDLPPQPLFGRSGESLRADTNHQNFIAERLA
ncbi:MAG TPA: hypothetical protein DCP63_12445 [Bacteroidetes bacterium]|nr:hypothetical protein [Bacteroidota bacterium]